MQKLVHIYVAVVHHILPELPVVPPFSKFTRLVLGNLDLQVQSRLHGWFLFGFPYFGHPIKPLPVFAAISFPRRKCWIADWSPMFLPVVFEFPPRN